MRKETKKEDCYRKQEGGGKMIVFFLIGVASLLFFLTCFLFVRANYLEKEEVSEKLSYVWHLEANETDVEINFEDENGYIWTISEGEQANIFSYKCEYNGKMCGGKAFIQITSPEISIGPKSISLGMKKDEVARILKNSRLTTPTPTVVVYVLDEYGEVTEQRIDNYYDDNFGYWIGFVYDNADCVKYIFIGFGL